MYLLRAVLLLTLLVFALPSGAEAESAVPNTPTAADASGVSGAADPQTADPQTGSDDDLSLVMFEQHGCLYCVLWHAQVGDAYSRTEEGRRAPLRRVDIYQPWPEDLAAIRRPTFTPTFVLARDGVEIDRLEGYRSEDFFWGLLEVALRKVD